MPGKIFIGTSRGSSPTNELFVDFEDAFELVQALLGQVRQVEVDHRLPVDAHVVFIDDLEDFSGGDIARYEIAVLGIALFEEVPAVGLGDGTRGALLMAVARHPDPAAFAAG
jgi:hypothetical protein